MSQLLGNRSSAVWDRLSDWFQPSWSARSQRLWTEMIQPLNWDSSCFSFTERNVKVMTLNCRHGAALFMKTIRECLPWIIKACILHTISHTYLKYCEENCCLFVYLTWSWTPYMQSVTGRGNMAGSDADSKRLSSLSFIFHNKATQKGLTEGTGLFPYWEEVPRRASR